MLALIIIEGFAVVFVEDKTSVGFTVEAHFQWMAVGLVGLVHRFGQHGNHSAFLNKQWNAVAQIPGSHGGFVVTDKLAGVKVIPVSGRELNLAFDRLTFVKGRGHYGWAEHELVGLFNDFTYRIGICFAVELSFDDVGLKLAKSIFQNHGANRGDAFVVVVTGGLGSLGGAFIVAIIFGLLNSYGIQFVSQLAPILMFAFMAIVLALKPTGLFGEREA